MDNHVAVDAQAVIAALQQRIAEDALTIAALRAQLAAAVPPDDAGN
jgi:hypothetical protein